MVEDVRLPQALMPEVVLNCDPDDPGQRGHNVEAIQQALARFAAPPDSALLSTFRAFDAFVGYLVFDALIAHGDRHDRNRAVLVPPLETKYVEALCPSFDHAASLGFTLTDETRAQHVHDGTVPRWASRGRAYRFEHRPGTRWQTLVELAHSAATLCESMTREHRRERIMAVDKDSVASVVAAAPGMSEIASRFTVELIMVNPEGDCLMSSAELLSPPTSRAMRRFAVAWRLTSTRRAPSCRSRGSPTSSSMARFFGPHRVSGLVAVEEEPISRVPGDAGRGVTAVAAVDMSNVVPRAPPGLAISRTGRRRWWRWRRGGSRCRAGRGPCSR
ncbi:Conserved protein of unknown function [Mycobacterium canettii CIPT 140070017]|nr:Conserved protein of unknown function [Mycobacterium canettii CIPT 140070017]